MEEVGTEPGSDFPGVSFDSQALELVPSEADTPSTLRIAPELPDLPWALLLTVETMPPKTVLLNRVSAPSPLPGPLQRTQVHKLATSPEPQRAQCCEGGMQGW